jgi:hypothetical protein
MGHTRPCGKVAMYSTMVRRRPLAPPVVRGQGSAPASSPPPAGLATNPPPQNPSNLTDNGPDHQNPNPNSIVGCRVTARTAPASAIKLKHELRSPVGPRGRQSDHDEDGRTTRVKKQSVKWAESACGGRVSDFFHQGMKCGYP